MSDNIKWGKRKSFSDGKVTLPYGRFLGYEKGADGLPQIVEGQAEIVRRIYQEYLSGKTPSNIAKLLTDDGIPTPGGHTVWQSCVIKSILTNEKYKVDAILQKTFTVDFLTKEKKVNSGEVPQYFIENSHIPIIRREIFEMVQEEFRRRRDARGNMVSVSILSSRIICGECGGYYGRKVWHSGGRYASTVWHCNNKFQKRKYCKTPTLKETAIKKAFVDAFNSLLKNKAEIYENYDEALDTITDDSMYKKEMSEIDIQCSEIQLLIERLIAVNARLQTEQSDYNERYNGYWIRYDKLQKRRREASTAIAMCAAKRVQITGFLSELKKHDTPLFEFDERVWQSALNHMKIFPDGRALFVFRDGSELPWTVDCEVRKYAKEKCQ